MHVVSLTYRVAADQATLEKWEDELGSDVSVASIPGVGVLVSIGVEGYDLIRSPMIAAEQANRVIGAELVGVEAMDEDDYLRRSGEPTLPELVSAPEVAEMLGGISRQRVHQLRANAAFPSPLYELRTGPVWDARAVEKFAREWTRKPGRPMVKARASQ